MPQLGAVRLLTHQLDAMVAWWSHILASRPLAHSARGALFAIPQGGQRVVITQSAIASEREIEAVGVDTIHLCYADAPALADAYERLAADGIVPEIAQMDGLSAAFAYRDPDGNGVTLELLLRDPLAVASWTDDPSGQRMLLAEEVDPDALVALIRRGVSADGLAPAMARNPHFCRPEEFV